MRICMTMLLYGFISSSNAEEEKLLEEVLDSGKKGDRKRIT